MPRGSKYFMGRVTPSSFSKDLQTSAARLARVSATEPTRRARHRRGPAAAGGAGTCREQRGASSGDAGPARGGRGPTPRPAAEVGRWRLHLASAALSRQVDKSMLCKPMRLSLSGQLHARHECLTAKPCGPCRCCHHRQGVCLRAVARDGDWFG